MKKILLISLVLVVMGCSEKDQEVPELYRNSKMLFSNYYDPINNVPWGFGWDETLSDDVKIKQLQREVSRLRAEVSVLTEKVNEE